MRPEIKLGEIITTPQERDAIHIAVVPAIAVETLQPGQHVGLLSKVNPVSVTKHANDTIGIVDPFLKRNVKKGEQCWVFLYQNTITSLRHDWSHPSLPSLEEAKAMQETFDELTLIPAARRWITEYAQNELDMSYDELIEAADDYVATGQSAYLNFDTPNAVYDLNDIFWDNYEIVKKTKISRDKKTPFFSCSC